MSEDPVNNFAQCDSRLYSAVAEIFRSEGRIERIFGLVRTWRVLVCESTSLRLITINAQEKLRGKTQRWTLNDSVYALLNDSSPR